MHVSTAARHAGKREAGLTLIEVLIAVLVVAFGLLGIAGLQTAALANTYLSYQTMQATMLAESMVDRMRANPEGLDDYALAPGAVPPDPATDCASAACSPDALAAWDIAVWYASMADDGDDIASIPAGPRGLLPAGRAAIVCADTPCEENSTRVITVFWDPGRTGASTYNCDPDSSTDFRCYRLTFTP